MHARPGADLYPNMSLVNDEHVVDEYVSYDEPLGAAWTLFHLRFLNDEDHMINDKTIGKMKDGVHSFVNTGRGGSIDIFASSYSRHFFLHWVLVIDVYEEEN